MRTASRSLAFLLLATTAFAGGEDEARGTKPRSADAGDPTELRKVAGAELELARDLIGACEEAKTGNVVLSPFSIYQALAMCAAGARGETADEMSRVLRFPLAAGKMHAALGALEQQLARRAVDEGSVKKTPAFALRTANALWGQTGRELQAPFLDLLAERYGAGLRLVDYASDPDAARVRINAWVAEKTEQRIKDLLAPPSVTTATRLVLVNAVYFKADWSTPFESEWTKPGPFTRADGSKVEASFMDRSAHFDHALVDGVRAVALPYVGGQVSAWILLPEAGKLDALVAELPTRLPALVSAAKAVQVEVKLPKLQFQWRAGLLPALQKLGLERATSADRADFSGMDGTRELFVGSVTHQAFLSVDEQGTEAAAATAVEMAAGGVPPPPIPFTVDRPFLFVVRDQPTGAVLFVARVMDPTAK